MEILRWCLFIPVAFVVGTIADTIVFWLSFGIEHSVSRVFHRPMRFVGRGITAAAAFVIGALFVAAGALVAPSHNKAAALLLAFMKTVIDFRRATRSLAINRDSSTATLGAGSFSYTAATLGALGALSAASALIPSNWTH
jgi:hypothetical protein